MELIKQNFISPQEKKDKKQKKFSSFKKRYTWKRKTHLDQNHPYYTLDWLSANTEYFTSLSRIEKMMLTLFWTTRTVCHSYNEIKEDLDLPDRWAAISLMQKLESTGILKIKHQKYKNPRKKPVFHGRNWYKLTYNGQKLIKAILNKAFNGIDLPNGMLLVGMKKYPCLIKPKKRATIIEFPKETLVVENQSKTIQKNSFNHITKSLRDNIICQGKLPFAANFSFEGNKDDDEITLEELRFELTKQEKKHETSKILAEHNDTNHKKLNFEHNDKLKKIFSKYGFLDKFRIANRKTLQTLQKEPTEKIKLVLKHIRAKLNKGWKLKNFWAYFTYQIKSSTPLSFRKYLAQKYRDAIDGKGEVQGVDVVEFINLCRELESKTKEKISQKTLFKILNIKHKSKLASTMQICKSALHGVKFRIQLDEKITQPNVASKIPKRPIKSWIGLFISSLKLGSVEAIYEAFFKRKEFKTA